MIRKPGVKEHKRLMLAAFVVLASFSLLIIQFYRIQIIEGEKWTEKAKQQHYFFITEPFVRGRFFSNNTLRRGHKEQDQPLVVDIEKFHLYIDPLSIPSHKRRALQEELQLLLSIPKEKQQHFRDQFEKKSRSRQIAMWLDPELKERIKNFWLPFASSNKIAKNALYFISDYQRSYPFGKLMGQLLHSIQNSKDPQTGQAIPTGGLEYVFNEELQGKIGKRRLMRSPRHSFETGEVILAPENGADIYLTLNPCLQAICEEEIEKGVAAVDGKAGWAVMMEPQSGAILAAAQYPFFHPGNCSEYFSNPELVEHTRLKAINDSQEPGSVMKPMTVAIALLANEELKKRGERPLFDPEEKMATKDGTFPGRKTAIRDTRVHNFLNMDMALQKSSNIYVGRLAERIINRLGSNWYRQALEKIFGFGVKTGIEMPSEHPGLLPLPGRKYPNGKLEWSLPTPFSLAMGYNLQANSLQVISAFATFANGGYLVKPTLLRKIVKEGKEKLNKVEKKKVLPEAIVKRVVEALQYDTKSGGGGFRADVAGYTEVGKTGTVRKIVDGQYTTKKYCCNFIGFPVIASPPFVLMVVIDEPSTGYREGVGHTYYGSVAAAPIFKEICRRSLEYLGIRPDDPCGYPTSDPRYDKDKAHWQREALLLQEKYEKWNK